jgi:RecA/RadA recombinase
MVNKMTDENEIDITNLELLPGVGANTSAKLKEGGILTIMSVATSTPGQLSDAAGVTAAAARKLINAARDLCKLGFELGTTIKEKQEQHRKYIPTHCSNIDNLFGGGLQLGTTMEIYAQFACLTGDTIINITRNRGNRKYSIEYLYKQFNNKPIFMNKKWNMDIETKVRSFNGETIQLNELKNVVYSGVKKVYKLSLIDGKSIKATADHKILTNNGWKELQELDKNKDLVMCDNLLPEFVKINDIQYVGEQDTYDLVCKEPHHNFVANGIVVHNSGKTQIGHMLAVSTIKQFPDATVIYIDTENTFSSKRIEHFSKKLELDPIKVLSQIKVGKAVSSDHQILLTENIEKQILDNGDNVKLIIIDSLMNHFRAEYLGRGTLAGRQQTINGYLHKIATLVANYGMAVYMTNQIQSDPGAMFGDPNKAIGGNIVAHFATTRAYVRKAAKGTRRMVLVDSPDLPEGEADYKITEDGLENV